MPQTKQELLNRHTYVHPDLIGPAYDAEPEMAETPTGLHPLKDAEIVFAFFAKVIEKLDDIYKTQIEQGFVVDFYGDNNGTPFSAAVNSSIIGSQNQGLYKTYNGPYEITSILATWNPTGSAATEVTPANPAAGANFSYTNTTGAAQTLTSLHVRLVTDAVVANRFVQVKVLDANGNTVLFLNASGAIPATTTADITLATGTTSVPNGTSGAISGGLPNVILQPGWVLQINVSGIDPGDQLSQIVLVFTGSVTTVTLQLGDRTLQLLPSLGLFNPQGLEIEMARDDQIVFTVTPPSVCHIEINGNVKKRVRETTL